MLTFIQNALAEVVAFGEACFGFDFLKGTPLYNGIQTLANRIVEETFPEAFKNPKTRLVCVGRLLHQVCFEIICSTFSNFKGVILE